ncbi:universal stress protein [Streptomyces sp. WMMC500]|uniref:universal stress protein n=1 Tax=Streptomyces sp. WMMC500 TaxID=3015154 RepID=UPI00248CABD2|nr:universal stress protein [Streptomyces sp. WMMC500]WBB61955.1 universal stress protein [Streptomyces sp. WMMC500]
MSTGRVLVGFDGSVPAVRALDLAAEEAVRRGAALEILYALPDVDGAAPVLAVATDRVRERHPGLEVVAVPVAGDPVSALVSRGGTAVLTVVGSRELGGIAGLVAGSVSRRTAGRAEGPVMVVRGDRPARTSPGQGHVLLVVCGDDEVDAAAFAFAEAQRRGVGLRVRHAGTYAPTTAEASAAPRASTATDPDRRASRSRDPRALVTTSAAQDAETGGPVLAVATRGRRHGAPRAVRSLLRDARCPVVLVPAR